MVLIDHGRKLQSFLHVDDAVQALRLAATAPRHPSGVFQITSGLSETNKQIFDIIAATLGVPPPSRSVPLGVACLLADAARRLGSLLGVPIHEDLDPFRVRLLGCHHHYSIEKARRVLGYEPRIPIGEGLARVIQASRPATRDSRG